MSTSKLEEAILYLFGALDPEGLMAIDKLRQHTPELEVVAREYSAKEREALETIRRLMGDVQAKFEGIASRYRVNFVLKPLERALRERRSHRDASYIPKTGGAVKIYQNEIYRLVVHLHGTKQQERKVLFEVAFIDPYMKSPILLDSLKEKFRLVVEDATGKTTAYPISTAKDKVYVDVAKLGKGPYTARLERI